MKYKTKRTSCKTKKVKKLFRRVEKFVASLPAFDTSQVIPRYISDYMLSQTEKDLAVYIPQLKAYIFRVRVLKRDEDGYEWYVPFDKKQDHLFVIYDDGERTRTIDTTHSLSEYLRQVILKNLDRFKENDPFYVITFNREEELKKHGFYIHKNNDFTSDAFRLGILPIFANFGVFTFEDSNVSETAFLIGNRPSSWNLKSCCVI